MPSLVTGIVVGVQPPQGVMVTVKQPDPTPAKILVLPVPGNQGDQGDPGAQGPPGVDGNLEEIIDALEPDVNLSSLFANALV